MPVRMSSSTSGILSLFPIHEQMTPTNNNTAIAVVMMSASSIVHRFFMFVVCFSL